jgi:hypothetical protein
MRFPSFHSRTVSILGTNHAHKDLSLSQFRASSAGILRFEQAVVCGAAPVVSGGCACEVGTKNVLFIESRLPLYILVDV